MQQATIFSILMILLSKRKVSRDYLAERFSISKRTVSRYLAVLEDAGVPITSETGPGGGVSLSENYVMDKTFFSEAESIRLRDALKRTDGMYSDNVNRALIEKIDSVEKTRERDTFVIRQQDLYIDCDYDGTSALRRKIKTLSQAIDSCRAVEINYSDAHGYISYRTIEPYTIVFKENAWYIYALCRLRGDFRLFKITRIRDLRLTSKRFVRLESRLIEKLELEYYNEVYVDLELEFYPSVTESIADWLGADAITERGTKFYATAEVPLTDGLIKRLLSYGSSVKVLTPELAQRMRDEIKLMSNIYSTDN